MARAASRTAAVDTRVAAADELAIGSTLLSLAVRVTGSRR